MYGPDTQLKAAVAILADNLHDAHYTMTDLRKAMHVADFRDKYGLSVFDLTAYARRQWRIKEITNATSTKDLREVLLDMVL